MSRLIDADEVIKFYANFINEHGFDPKDARFSIRDIEMNLLNIPTVDKWIPVSEGLPEESGDYLVTMLWWNEVEKEQATLLKPIKVLDGKYYWGCPQKMAVLEWFKCFDDETGEDCSEWFIGEDMIPDDLEVLAWQKTPKQYGEEE